MSERDVGERLYLLNYSDDRFCHKGGVFRKSQLAMNESARRQGITDIVSWQWSDLTGTDFYTANREYLERPCRLNGFVFKPFITLQLLQQIDDGDLILYYDSGDGSHIIDCPLDPLVELCKRNDGTVIAQWGERNRNWTKRDCFVFMDCDKPRFHDAVAHQATWFLIQKSERNIGLIREWLHLTLDERVGSYDNRQVSGLPELPGFREHRGDQSVLSLLAIRNGLHTFYGAGGPSNRRLGEFVRTLCLTGFVRAQSGRCLGAARQYLRRARTAWMQVRGEAHKCPLEDKSTGPR